MFWQKLIIVAHYLCIWSWIITIFDQKKEKKIDAFLHVQKGPPFGLYVEKIVDVNFFGNFKKKSLKWLTQGLSNIESNKVMKNQPIWGIPRGLASDNQPGGVNLTPPHVE